MSGSLVRSITLSQGIALYVGAVVGAGVLILPGVAATAAGPASVLAWGFDSLLGIPLALTFAALAARAPDAGGVATFTAEAFGPVPGAVVGWFYYFAAATGQVIVPLTGAYYAADALGLGRGAVFLLAAGILAAAVASNLRGLRVSGPLQLVLSGAVVVLLLGAAVAAAPRISVEHWAPFAPHGYGAVGRTSVLIFFAVFGWEAIAQLSAEFKDPARDVPRSTVWSVGLIALLYMGVAAAVVGTGTYGETELDRVAVARVLSDSLGLGAGWVAGAMALLISLGTANAFVAAISRLGYALGRDGSFPAWMSQVDGRGVPARAVAAVGVFAAAGLGLAYVMGWGAEHLLVVPNSLGIATYIIGTAAGVKLLAGRARWMAGTSLLLCVAAFPFAGASMVLPLVVAGAAWGYRAGVRRPVGMAVGHTGSSAASR